MKAAWLTDIHLNSLECHSRNEFYDKIVLSDCNSIFITGDIAESTSITDILITLYEKVKKPLYFVLGNHDYYKSTMNDTRDKLKQFTHQKNDLFWLQERGPIKLNNNTTIVGVDGWADGRHENISKVLLC